MTDTDSDTDTDTEKLAAILQLAEQKAHQLSGGLLSETGIAALHRMPVLSLDDIQQIVATGDCTNTALTGAGSEKIE